MEKEFVPYELSVKLKELGFDEPCFGVWNSPKGKMEVTLVYMGNLHNGYINDKESFKICAPLWQQAFDWFREKGLHSWIYQSNRYSFHYTILKEGRYAKNGSDTIHYQEARQACLEKLIELITKND